MLTLGVLGAGKAAGTTGGSITENAAVNWFGKLWSPRRSWEAWGVGVDVSVVFVS